jgi:16S rRNA (cytosine967-C5)-methyltransferase
MCVELAFGTLRNQGFYDWLAGKVTARDVLAIDPDALDVIRLGAHQLLGMRTPPHAALNETVNLAKKVLRQGAVGFVNAALRRISEKPRDEWVRILERDVPDPARKNSILISHPEWIVNSLNLALEADGRNEVEKLLRANNDAPAVNLVALPNHDFVADDDLVKEGVSPLGYRLEGGDPAHLPGFRSGAMRVQDQGSQLAALALVHVAKVQPGERWLDLCAGPGGKAALLGAEAEINGATLVANEISNHRARLVSQALADSGVKARVVNEDGRTLNLGQFDRIMIDAPCTGLGALRRRPESRWRKSPDDLKQLNTLQSELIESGWRQLKVGGYLAYVTCSPHPAETTAILSKLLSKHKDAELVDAGTVIEAISDEFMPNRSRKTVQLWPHTDDTDAMFISLIRKVG